MATVGPNLGLIDDGGYGEAVYAETLRMYRAFDMLIQPKVKSLSTSVPPLSPAEGDAYIVPEGASGEWSVKIGQVARWTARSAVLDGTWEYFTPHSGWEFGVDDIDCRVRYSGTAWVGSGVIVSATPPSNGDGRPDGTVYFQHN